MLTFKKKKPNNNYVYEIHSGNKTAVIHAFFEYMDNLAAVKLVFRQEKGDKVVVAFHARTELWALLPEMEQIGDDEQKKDFWELCIRWVKMLVLIDTLNQTRACGSHDTEYLAEVAKVLQLPHTNTAHLEGQCVQKLLAMLSRFEEFSECM